MKPDRKVHDNFECQRGIQSKHPHNIWIIVFAFFFIILLNDNYFSTLFLIFVFKKNQAETLIFHQTFTTYYSRKLLTCL